MFAAAPQARAVGATFPQGPWPTHTPQPLADVLGRRVWGGDQRNPLAGLTDFCFIRAAA